MKWGWVFAIMFWIAAVVLPLSMAISNDSVVKTVDLSAVRANQIIAGTNLMKTDFESQVSSFLGKSYDLVMVGLENSRGSIVYLGEKDNQWYRAEEFLSMGLTQEAKDIRINNQILVVTCGKDVGVVVLLSILSFVIFALLGSFAVAQQ